MVSARTTTLDPRSVAETVTDPELPMLTLSDLGVLRDVRVERSTVVVEITPTYTGCPAMGVMRADLVHALHLAGFGDVEVRTVLSPAWTTDWISEEGRRKLAAGGIAPPAKAPAPSPGPVPLDLGLTRPEPVVLDEVVGDVEADRHGVVGELLDTGHRERVELRAAPPGGRHGVRSP